MPPFPPSRPQPSIFRLKPNPENAANPNPRTLPTRHRTNQRRPSNESVHSDNYDEDEVKNRAWIPTIATKPKERRNTTTPFRRIPGRGAGSSRRNRPDLGGLPNSLLSPRSIFSASPPRPPPAQDKNSPGSLSLRSNVPGPFLAPPSEEKQKHGTTPTRLPRHPRTARRDDRGPCHFVEAIQNVTTTSPERNRGVALPRKMRSSTPITP